jgi:serine/threonine protein kinase
MAKYTVRGKGETTLTDRNFITEGGEGKVYGKGSTIYKIYSDINKMIPEAKIKELEVLTSPNIMNPQNVILDQKSRMVGFTMDRIDNSLPICKLFTTDFRNRNNITPEIIVDLVDNIQETLNSIHEKKIICVDLNELNYLVKENDFKTPYFIDVDSYQTPNFPATAIMPNIRDYNTNGFNRLTDWYSFAIIAFQLFIGIHPFKGKNPNFKKNSLIERMKQNVSVFDKDTRVPASTRDFSHIPSHYMAWFERLFQKGERLEPPSIAGLLNVMQVQTEIIDSTDNFIIKFLRDYKNPVTSYFNFSGTDGTTTTKEGYIGKVGYDIDNANSVLVFGEKFLTPIIATVTDEKLVLTNLKTNVIIPNVFINAKKITKVGNKLFVYQGEKFLEVGIVEMNGKVLANVAKTYNVMPNSTQVFDGFLYSTMLEKPYLMIPQNGNFVPVPVKELEKYKIIDGKFENGVCVITAYKDGGYDRFTFVFEGVNYTFRKDEDVAGKSVNFTVLSNGIVVSITDDGTMEIFKNDSSHNKMKVIHDPAISSDMKLCNNGLEVLFYRGNEMYSLKMK